MYNWWGGYSWFRAAYRTWFYWTSFIISARAMKNQRNASKILFKWSSCAFNSTTNLNRLNYQRNCDLPSQYFTNTSIWNLKNARNITRSGTRMCQFDNLLSCWVGQWSAIYINSTQLVDTAMTCWRTAK